MRYSFIVFLLAILLAGCGKPHLTGVAVDRDLRPYIPPSVQALASIQLDKLKATDLYKRHAKDLDLPEFNAIQERFGLDPRRDVASLLVIWDGKQSILLTKGTFAPDQLTQRLQTYGAKSSQYKDYTLWGTPAGVLTFVNSGLSVGGSVDAVHLALDQKNGDGGVPDALDQQLNGVLKDSQIWEVSRGGVPLSLFPQRSDVQSLLGNFVGAISETTIGLHCDRGVRLQADIKCVSKEGAQRVHDALRGLVGLARLSTDVKEVDLLRIWDAVDVDQDQDRIHVSVDLSDNLTERLFTYLPRLQNRALRMTKPF